jgi:Helicase conserved C-terminal domain
MQHYAAPDSLRAAGVDHFDAWASNFAAQVTRLELAPEGTHYRLVTRLAKFRNVPDLVRMFSVFADVRTKADLNLPVPALRNGHAEVVVVPGNDDLATYVAELGDRAERVRNRAVDPTEDNMLKISSDGRAAALDVRLVHLDVPLGPTKVSVAADRIHGIWSANRDRRFTDSTGRTHARPGALQLVFVELGTPGGARWGLYDELRSQLVERGMPPAAVRFVHEARNAREKEQLFAGCRNGAVAVLLGTTEKMGVGTNVQARCVALHHLDCPWRPADVEQREGRILRQGNQHDVVDVLRYVTAGSFDVYMWQTVETKAGFINQVLSGRVGSRQLDDVASDQELSYAEVKALATGDDRIVRKAGLEADVARLQRKRSAHLEDQSRLQRTISRNEARSHQLTNRAALLDTQVADIIDTRGGRFAMTVAGFPYTERVAAGTHILTVVEEAMNRARTQHPVETDLGDLGGISWRLRCHPASPSLVELGIAGTGLRVTLERPDLPKIDPARLVQRLENAVSKLPSVLDDARHEIDALGAETAAARQRLGVTFPDLGELTRLESELQTLDAELAAADRDAAPTRRASLTREP